MTPEVAQKVRVFFASYPERTYEAGDIIARAGKPLPGVLYLEAGQVIQYDIADDGRQVVVNTFKPPSFFPMSWAINGTPNVYFYEAKQATTVYCAPPEQVVKFLEQEPDVLFNLLARVYRGTDGVLRRMAHALGGRALTLVLFELIISCKRFGKHTKGNITLTLTDQDLADQTGLSRETVNRVLQELKANNLLSLGYRTVVIRDLAELESFLGDRL